MCFIPEFGFGPLCVDHPPAVYTVRGSALGADRREQLLRAGISDSAGHHPGLAHTEDGTTPVGKHYHTFTHTIEHISVYYNHNIIYNIMYFVRSLKKNSYIYIFIFFSDNHFQKLLKKYIYAFCAVTFIFTYCTYTYSTYVQHTSCTNICCVQYRCVEHV